jgi:hypothetical protein
MNESTALAFECENHKEFDCKICGLESPHPYCLSKDNTHVLCSLVSEQARA